MLINFVFIAIIIWTYIRHGSCIIKYKIIHQLKKVIGGEGMKL